MRFTSAADLVIAIEVAHRQRRFKELMHRTVAAPKLLIIDEIGYLRFGSAQENATQISAAAAATSRLLERAGVGQGSCEPCGSRPDTDMKSRLALDRQSITLQSQSHRCSQFHPVRRAICVQNCSAR